MVNPRAPAPLQLQPMLTLRTGSATNICSGMHGNAPSKMRRVSGMLSDRQEKEMYNCVSSLKSQAYCRSLTLDSLATDQFQLPPPPAEA